MSFTSAQIKAILDENERLSHQVYNLTLYLEEALAKCERIIGHDGLGAILNDAFDGMGSYVPVAKELRERERAENDS